MSRKRLSLVVLLVAAPFLLLAAVRGSAVLASSLLEKRYPPPGKLISVGDHKLQLYCMGHGSPTIVIEPGMGTDWVAWRLVIPQLLEFSKVCVYDRAGYGWSEPGPWPRTAGRIAGELHVLLSKAGLEEPYILVAHSFGGYIARIYASQYRQSLQGVVLVDPSHEDDSAGAPAPDPAPRSYRLSELIPPLGIQRLRRLYEGDKALSPQLRNLPRSFQNRYLIGSSLVQLRSERNEFDSSFGNHRPDAPRAISPGSAAYRHHRRRSAVSQARGNTRQIGPLVVIRQTDLSQKQWTHDPLRSARPDRGGGQGDGQAAAVSKFLRNSHWNGRPFAR